MKKIIILLLCFSITQSACKKDDENNNPNYAMEAKIDGVDFNTFNVSQALTGGSMQVSGFDGDRLIQLFIPDNTIPGTYDFGIGEVTGQYEDMSIPVSVTSISGTLIITEIDPGNARFQATFDFEANVFGGDTVSVTQGSVDYDY